MATKRAPSLSFYLSVLIRLRIAGFGLRGKYQEKPVEHVEKENWSCARRRCLLEPRIAKMSAEGKVEKSGRTSSPNDSLTMNDCAEDLIPVSKVEFPYLGYVQCLSYTVSMRRLESSG